MKNTDTPSQAPSSPGQGMGRGYNPSYNPSHGPGYGNSGYGNYGNYGGYPTGDAGMPTVQPTPGSGGGTDFDIARLLKRLYRHWAILLVLWLLFASIGLSKGAQQGLTFYSQGRLNLGSDSGRGNGGGALSMSLLGGGGSPDLFTQQLILRSNDLACEVIRANGLNAALYAANPKVQEKISYRPQFWQWEGPRLVGSLPVLNQLVSWKPPQIEQYAPGLQVRESNTNPNLFSQVSYTIEFVDDKQFKVKNGNKMLETTGRLGELVRTSAARFKLEASDVVMAQGDEVNITIGPDFAYVGGFLGNLGVTVPGNAQQTSNMIQISYASDSPFVAQQVVESVMDIYLKRSLKAATYSSERTYEFVSKLMETVREKLEVKTKALTDAQKRIGSFTLDPIVAKQIDGVAKAEARLLELRQVLPRLQETSEALKHADGLEGDDRCLIELAALGSPAVQAAIADYRTAQGRLRQYKRTFTDGHAILTQARTDVDKTWGGLAAIVQAQIAETNESIKRAEVELAKNQAEFNNLPDSQRVMAGLMRDVQVLQTNYDSLLAERTRADIARETTISNYSVTDHARPALGPSSPTLSQAVSSSLGLAFLLAAMLVMLPGLRIRWFETVEEAIKAVSAPVFGVLPSTGQRSRRGERKILVEDPNSRWAEAMRLLRTNLLQAMAGKAAQVVMVSGAQPGDGKSTVAANLAASLAQSSRIKSVLLIDADMHRPSLHGVFGVPQSPGLSDYLNGSATIAQVVHQVVIPGGETLSFIPAGPIPPVPSDLVETPAMQALFDYARENHVFTVLDTPPYPLVSVAGTLAEHVDRVLTVCRIGRTVRKLYQRHVEHLARHGAHVGQVFNAPSLGRLGGVQDGYGSYGSYGYGYGKNYGGQEKRTQEANNNPAQD